MSRLISFIIIPLMFLSSESFAQKKRTDANIVGHVVCQGEHLPFVTLFIKGTTIGTTTDETGHYRLVNLPKGTYTVRVQSVGFKPSEKQVVVMAGQTQEINFDLQKDVLGIDEVVVTADRNETRRTEASVIVNTITPTIFARTQSVTLSEGLNFCPGLRMENDCSNCGFSQVRMNGMEGSYSQILINSRPIFSGLAGVYGLELIPSNMIERVEVIRGGGSALYGSNAIAGTINLILKDPVNDSYEIGVNSGLIGLGIDGSGDVANDLSVNMNTSIVSSDRKTGMALYGFYRDREPFDANNDEFSEIALMKNTTIGGRIFHRLGSRSKLSADFFTIKENRRGGDKMDSPPHEASIAEAVDHVITTGAVTYEQFFRDTDLFSVYLSGQNVDRDSYYGANQSLSDYGKTEDFSYVLGAQYTANWNLSNLVVGLENNWESLTDTKLGYLDIANATSLNDIPHTDDVTVADQTSNTFGAFAQYSIDWNKFNFSVGARFDHYNVEDKQAAGSAKKGDVFSPRVTVKYDLLDYLQVRTSYSHGYRAPQIFDEDLHIETSGSRQVVHRNDPNLKQEISNSYMASLDFNKKIGKVNVGFLLEGFLTKLDDPFANEFSDPDAQGRVTYTRINAKDGATVRGMNMELNVVPSAKFSMKGGFTMQKSRYEVAQQFNEKSFLRTPENYGYVTLDWNPTKHFGFSSTGNYTGKMLVPYFGTTIANPEDGELRESGKFFDLGLKLRYTVRLNGAKMQLFTGIKNIFNSYQDDFDRGIDRDPGYIYGPMNPRTVYFGIKIGNMIK